MNLTIMRALVAYSTMSGQTEKVAMSIAAGMREEGFSDVVVKKIDQTNVDDFRSADVWIIGSPTHFGGATGELKNALKQAVKDGANGKKGMAFDTRIKRVSQGAANKIERMLSEAGVQIVVGAAGFIVTKGLDEGEEEKALALGKKIAIALRP